MENRESSDKKSGDSKVSEKDASPPPPTATEARPLASNNAPSMTLALFFTWVVPVFLFAVFSRKIADTDISPIPLEPSSRPATPLPFSKRKDQQRPSPGSSVAPSRWPTDYAEIVDTIRKRRRLVTGLSPDTARTGSSQKSPRGSPTQSPQSSSPQPKRGASTDPARLKFREKIDALREDYRQNPKDIYRGIQCADAMRLYDMQYHEGGTYEMQAIELYDELIAKAEAKRDEAISQKKATNISSKKNVHSANDEVTVDYEAKSEDGLVCALYTAKGKLCFMANMFERAVASYDACLEIAPGYLDAVNARGSALIVLGEYERASHDFLQVIENDNHRLFIDSFSGIARVLEAKEDAVPGGWEAVVPILEELIPAYERRLDSQPRAKNIIAESLNRLHLAMFAYNDVKAKNFPVAFRHLSQAHKHKMSALPPWNKGFELVKIAQTKNIFKAGFWPPGIGSETQTPIFIIGFVRSGSTLLERILDAHSLIVGTGENSVFNGRLDDIRNQIVEVSVSGQPGALESLTRRLAYEVVDEMRNRWEVIEASTERPSDEALKEDPKRFVDKMLTNYYNVGFIQMLYPKALILHVAREPMDTIFSAYKHEFPSGTLDYTSDFEGLAELYHSYRDVMEHWDEVLPGRVTHVRYEDMVNDMPGMARAIIDATGLPWDESVLDFHKKKHAVNTLSSTQVRKGIYKDSLKSWMRYEHELQPLVKLIGDRVKYDLKTTLPSYRPPEGNDA